MTKDNALLFFIVTKDITPKSSLSIVVYSNLVNRKSSKRFIHTIVNLAVSVIPTILMNSIFYFIHHHYPPFIKVVRISYIQEVHRIFNRLQQEAKKMTRNLTMK